MRTRTPRKRPTECQSCGKKPKKPEEISFRGYCIECGIQRAITATREMAAKSGPTYDKWIEGMQHAIVAAAAQRKPANRGRGSTPSRSR